MKSDLVRTTEPNWKRETLFYLSFCTCHSRIYAGLIQHRVWIAFGGVFPLLIRLMPEPLGRHIGCFHDKLPTTMRWVVPSCRPHE